MAMLLVMLWDGFLIIGEGFGLEGQRQRRFADIAWVTLITLLVTWLVAIATLTPAMIQ